MDELSMDEIAAAFTVVSLRTELRNLGLSGQGTKDILVKRLYFLHHPEQNVEAQTEDAGGTSTPNPRSLDIGETLDPSGYIWDNQCILKNDEDLRVTPFEPIDQDVSDELFQSGAEDGLQEADPMREQMTRLNNLFMFTLGASEFRHPEKLTESLREILNEANRVAPVNPEIMPELRAFKQNVESELNKAMSRQQIRETVETSIWGPNRAKSDRERLISGSCQTLLVEDSLEKKINERLVSMVNNGVMDSVIKRQVDALEAQLSAQLSTKMSEWEGWRQAMDIKLARDGGLKKTLESFPVELGEVRSDILQLRNEIMSLKSADAKLTERLQYYEPNTQSLEILANMSRSQATSISNIQLKLDEIGNQSRNFKYDKPGWERTSNFLAMLSRD